jgi:glycosyltransferase involved in cell wall biosynthesis
VYKRIAFIGSEGPHIHKFLNFFSGYFERLILITNKVPDNIPSNCTAYVVDFSLKKPWNLYLSVKKIKDILEKERPEVIHIHQANSYAFYSLLANRKYNIPNVLSPWGSDILILPEKNFLMRQMVKYNLKHADLITLEAFFEAKVVRELLGKIKKDIRLINFGIYDDYFVEIEEILKNKENIVFSSRLHKKLYRIDEIIRAFGRIIKEKPYLNWRLVIAGEGEETPKLKKLVYDNNLHERVEFIGWLEKEELKKWYLKSKIFVSIPVSDGVPFSVLEAMACGCLPVVSNVPSVLEFLIEGLNGVVAENIEELDRYIYKAMELFDEKNFLLELITLNRKILEKHAVYSKNMREFLNIYREILVRNRR